MQEIIPTCRSSNSRAAGVGVCGICTNRDHGLQDKGLTRGFSSRYIFFEKFLDRSDDYATFPFHCFCHPIPNPMKPLLICLFTLCVVCPIADAAAPPAKQTEKQKELQKKRDERTKKNKAVMDFMKTKDTNHDGSLTKAEYIIGEGDAATAGKAFDEANKNGDRALSKSEIADMLGL